MARQQQSGREQQQQQQQRGTAAGSGAGGSAADQQQQQQRGAQGGGAGIGGTAGGTAGAATGGGGAGGAPASSGAGVGSDQGGAEGRGERLRSVPTSRESGGDVGAGSGAAGAAEASGSTMQRSPSGGVRSGVAGSRQPPSLMSSFFSGDPFAVADQMVLSPFSFMRRFSEDMDRLFADFGFAPGSYGYGSAGYGPAGYGLTGGASPALGNREVGGQQQHQQHQQQQQQQRSAAQGRSLQQQGSGRQRSSALAGRGSVWAPQIELFQRGDQIVVRADLPGLNKDDVNVEVHDGILTISGERREQYEDRGEGFFHSERSYGSFHRSIPLPEGVNEEQINAQFRDGVLEVTIPIPRQEQQRGRRIDIRS